MERILKIDKQIKDLEGKKIRVLKKKIETLETLNKELEQTNEKLRKSPTIRNIGCKYVYAQKKKRGIVCGRACRGKYCYQHVHQVRKKEKEAEKSEE